MQYKIWTTLMVACQKWCLEVVHALLTKGADMEAKNDRNKTTLQLTP
jgi:ankyrin repeat protein